MASTGLCIVTERMDGIYVIEQLLRSGLFYTSERSRKRGSLFSVSQSESDAETHSAVAIGDSHIMQVITLGAVEFAELHFVINQQRISEYLAILVGLESRSYHMVT